MFIRIERYNKFKDGKARILISTDVFARGVDIERVNIVINYDMPENSDTYLHRVCVKGESGRRCSVKGESGRRRMNLFDIF